MPAMRMRNEDFRDHVRIIFEELRILLQIFGNRVYIHSLLSSRVLWHYASPSACGGGGSHAPSNTFVAAPFIVTGR